MHIDNVNPGVRKQQLIDRGTNTCVRIHKKLGSSFKLVPIGH